MFRPDAVRRLSREEELHLKPERLLRMRWLLVWKCAGSGRKVRARLVILELQHPKLTSLPTAAPARGKMTRHVLLKSCALHHFRLHFGDVLITFLADVSIRRGPTFINQRPN